MYVCAHVGMSVYVRHECVLMCVSHEIRREFRMNGKRDNRLKWDKRDKYGKSAVK